MKIALYQPWIYLHGGLEKSLLELVTRSEHEWIVYTGYYDPENTFKEFANVDVRVLNQTTVKRTIGGTLKSAFQVSKQKIPTENIDIVAVWCDGIGDLITFRNHKLPLLNICSTPLRAAFDPVYEQLALKGRGILYKVAYKTFKYLFTAVDRLAWSYYDGVITTSSEVKNRIIKGNLCTDEAAMTMAYPGIEWKEDVSNVTYQPFILLPGRIMWTKNIQQGIKAFVKAGLPSPWKLVVAGFLDAKSHSYLQDMRDLVPEGVEVEFVISPSSQQLNSLYSTASFCLFTPLNEDWGIVPLESMGFAKPVIANASGGPLESVVHGQTGFLHAPEDIDSWANSMRALALNPTLCKTMGQQAHQHVKQFTWQTFVSKVDQAIKHLANAKARD
ncbi:glycosyltransferase [Methylotenera sp.]|uniref:glycosyltransferase n=1 Tax=Methylotenera sp. TaxID=2051956 RepID=UPI00248844B1|nr:glycosyltransferase [Methylotenera sp.]MDI1297800.1 glycosyltransferase [Methylotenera sp.]